MSFRPFLLLILSLLGNVVFSQYEVVQEVVVDSSAYESGFHYIKADSLVRTNYSTDNALHPKKIDPNFKNKYQIKGINNQIAYACGYLKENEDVTRRQAVEIIRRILFEKI